MNTMHSLFSLQDIPSQKICTYKTHYFYNSAFFSSIPPKTCRKVLAKFLSLFSTKAVLRNLAYKAEEWNFSGMKKSHPGCCGPTEG